MRWLLDMLNIRRGPDPATIARLDALNQEIARLRRESACRRTLATTIARYFIRNERTPDIWIPFDEVTVDSNPEWMPHILERKSLSEPEFAVFRFFAGQSGTILDIGANYGYAAASIWAAGSTLPILSFEPNAWHKVCLDHIKAAKPDSYDFQIIGLGAARDSLRFVMPVIAGVGLSALSTAAVETVIVSALPENLVIHILNNEPGPGIPSIQFTEIQWDILPLDEVLRTHTYRVPLDQIQAIKIDVEGYEFPVLTGAKETIARHKPVLMIEDANRAKRVTDLLESLGYAYGDMRDNAIALTDQLSTRANGFFVHRSRLDEYRQLGLLVN